MKLQKIILICFVFGVVFVIFPTGEQNITVYNTCSTGEVCAQWYSGQEEITLSGIPFETAPTALFSSTVEMQDVIGNNEIKILANFISGVLSGLASIGIFSKLKDQKRVNKN